MGKLAVLKFGQGSFDSGFPVTLRLGNEGEAAALEIDGYLPAAVELLELLQIWQFSYRSRGTVGSFRQLKVPKAQVTRQRFSLVTIAKDWVQAMNQWLNASGSFQSIRDQLLKAISQGEEVRLLIQTEQLELWQLPWHLWDLLHDHPNVDVTFSLATFTKPAIQPQHSKPQVRILVLLGDSTNIDIQTDLKVLAELVPDAEIYMPTQVQREQLCHDLWQQSWDILFFAGHSSSQLNEGRFYLNPDVYLTIDDLCYALQRAISKGLQLAIFNSCDGLGLAHRLADLQLPAALVMREKIPDEAAQKFLHYFLESFAHSERSLHLAVRDAREKLHAALDDKYPCASWLPLVYQSPVSPSLSWRSLLPSPCLLPPEIPSVELDHSLLPRFRQAIRWQTALTVNLMVFGVIWGGRSLGWLEPVELWAYDQMMRLRPQLEKLDSRLLIVGVTDADLEKYGFWDSGANRRLLSDHTLAQALTQLQQYQPRVIGVDIIRDIPLGSGKAGQTKLLQQLRSQNVISPCKMASDDRDHAGYSPPPTIPTEQLGYINFAHEPIVRQHLLKMEPDDSSVCHVDHAFSTRLAVRYLRFTQALGTPKLDIQIGTKVLPVVRTNVGGYQSPQSRSQFAYGYHLLLNYRAASQIANQVSLTQLLIGQVNPERIKDKLILVGYVARSTGDYHATPFSQDDSIDQKMPGVIIHAHMISQILSAVENDRPLLNPWSAEGEAAWIGIWGIVGGLLVLRWRSARLIYAGSFTLMILVGSSFILFCHGAWVPCIPAGLTLSGSISGLVIQTRFQTHYGKRRRFNHETKLSLLD